VAFSSALSSVWRLLFPLFIINTASLTAWRAKGLILSLEVFEEEYSQSQTCASDMYSVLLAHPYPITLQYKQYQWYYYYESMT